MPDEQSEFVFHRGFYLVELTGEKAENLKEFLRCIQTVDDGSIFYHMYHTVLKHHFSMLGYSNDFAHWLRNELHEDALAEKFTNVRRSEYKDVGALREKLVGILKKRLKDPTNNGFGVSEDRAFHFVKYRVVVLPTKYRAKNIEEFVECLKKINRKTLFYHFFSARLKFKNMSETYVDDFSRWINETGHPDIADKIVVIDPHGYTLEGIRKEIIGIMERRLG